MNGAMSHYQMAASSNSEIGKASAQRFTRLDLPRNAGRYLKGMVQLDNRGNLYAVVQNPTSVSVSRVQLRVVRFNAKSGRAEQQSNPLLLNRTLASNQQGNLQVPGVRLKSQDELRLYRVVIESARVVD